MYVPAIYSALLFITFRGTFGTHYYVSHTVVHDGIYNIDQQLVNRISNYRYDK